MPCCCGSTLNLCSRPVCGTLKFVQGADAPESGSLTNIHTLVLDYLDTTVTITQDQITGEGLFFNISNLNENYQYTGQIYNSKGELVEIRIGELTFDCIIFKTILSLNPDTPAPIPPALNIPGTVVIEAVVDQTLQISGTSEPVTGITEESNTIISNAFAGVRIIMIRGFLPIPGIDPGDGSNYFTKQLASDFITLSDPLTEGEFIRIQTIPQ